MVKVKVFIRNEVEFLDETVFVFIQLPSVPRIGETLYLEERHYSSLKEQISNSENSKHYEDLELEVPIFVFDIAYYSGLEFVCIEISQNIPE